MKLKILILLFFFFGNFLVFSQEKAHFYLWLEPEWFEGVSGNFAYWPGPDSAKKSLNHWAIAGPGISAEWSQGGESEWNSIGAGSDETNAECRREIFIPSAGRYRIWVRYVDHRNLSEPFTVAIEKSNNIVLQGELGKNDIVPDNDEYQLYWGFSFGWAYIEGEIPQGQSILKLIINKPGEAWRQVDAICITDDFQWIPYGREKPQFSYFSSFDIRDSSKRAWRGSGKQLNTGSIWKRPPVAGKDFSMWTGVSANKQWWSSQDIENLSLYDVFFENACGSDIKNDFKKQFAKQKDIPIISWDKLVSGFYLGETPDLSPDSPLRKWLEKTGVPFYILTNYANPVYNENTGPATYQALTGPIAKQFLGYIHGETIGTSGVSAGEGKLGENRRQHLDNWAKNLIKNQTEAWSKFYKTTVSPQHIEKSIPCLSVESISLAHLFHHIGMKIVGYELDATNMHAPVRIAFQRGAARQYDGAWINYASANFGDACNYFTQEPVVPRGAKSWFHSKYSITDGVSISWYRKFYYLNYLSGASAIFWEQSLVNQWIKPGPGNHPVQLSPFGRATVDFQEFVNRIPDRGEPFTPVAFLLSYGHGYENVNYTCKMLNAFVQDKNDIEIRELFNVAWHPSAILEGHPHTPELSMPSGIYGNIFDILVDRPERAEAIFSYPVVWVAGDAVFDNKWISVIEDYLRKGGTIVLNVEAVRKNKNLSRFTGVKITDETKIFNRWSPDGKKYFLCVDYPVYVSKLEKAEILGFADEQTPIITRNAVGEGAVICIFVPHLVGFDERAHPCLPYVMNMLTENIAPFEIFVSGQRLNGELMYLINRTKDGWIVALFNNQGIDKTQNGIARVDRRKYVDAEIKTQLKIKSAKEYTVPRNLSIEKSNETSSVKIRVEPGDVQVIYFVTE